MTVIVRHNTSSHFGVCYVLVLVLLLLSAVAGGPLAFLGFLALVVGVANFLAQLASGKVSRSVVEKLEQELTQMSEEEFADDCAMIDSEGLRPTTGSGL